jgi:hypothetical protein
MPREEELDYCAPFKRKTITWTPKARLNSLGHPTGFSTSEDFNKAKVIQDWISINCQSLGLPHLAKFKHHESPCKRFAIDGDHLHSCTQHVGATMGAHGHILTALQRLFTKAGYRTDRKNVPHAVLAD